MVFHAPLSNKHIAISKPHLFRIFVAAHTRILSTHLNNFFRLAFSYLKISLFHLKERLELIVNLYVFENHTHF